MVKKDAVVKSKTGLHARPGSMVAEKAMNFDSEISLVFGDKKVDAKEVLDVVTSNINCGDKVSIEAEGPDEEQAVLELVELIETME